jgi:hypothetical protein
VFECSILIYLNTSHGLWVSISLLHVSNAENESEKKAKGTNCDVANGQEVVLSTQGVGRGEDEALTALERGNLILVIDPNLVAALIEAIVDSAP